MRSLIYFLCLCVCVSGVDVSEEYYWKDYDHGADAPNDVLYAGNQRNQLPTFIGNTIIRGETIPGNFNPYRKKLYFSYDDEMYVTKEHIKILCTKHPERFEWIKTDKSSVKNLNKDTLVVGGIVSGKNTYIGKASVDDDMVVGKVVISKYDEEAYVKIVSHEGEVSPFEFHILNYKSENACHQ